MKMFGFSLKDKVAEEFSLPFFAKNNGVGVRIGLGIIKNVLGNQDDYELHCVGRFDTERGEMEFIGSESVLIPWSNVQEGI